MVDTEAAWRDGKEVVEVWFDPKRTSYEDLVRVFRRVARPSTAYVFDDGQEAEARRLLDDVARAGAECRPAKASDRRYHLRRSRASYLPLTEVQAVRANALLAAGKALEAVLSPRQAALLRELEALEGDVPAVLGKLTPARRPEEFAAYEKRLRAALRARRPERAMGTR